LASCQFCFGVSRLFSAKREFDRRCFLKRNHVCLSSIFILLFSAFALAQSTGSSNDSNVSGHGTTGFVPLWQGATTLGNSIIFESKTRQVGIGTVRPAATFDVRPASLVLAISARGANAPAGSGNNGADGLHATGGNADPSLDGGNGGNGLHGTGGTAVGGGGAGVVGTGGAGTFSDGIGVVGIGGGTSGDAVDGIPPSGCSSCLAGNFFGNVTVTGTLSATTKNFKIDHPLDPANKYLVHASVESSEMKNIYDGTVVLDQKGEAVVQLPDWFEAANGSFRYQLTAIGGPCPGLYIAQKVTDNHFKIAGEFGKIDLPRLTPWSSSNQRAQKNAATLSIPSCTERLGTRVSSGPDTRSSCVSFARRKPSKWPLARHWPPHCSQTIRELRCSLLV